MTIRSLIVLAIACGFASCNLLDVTPGPKPVTGPDPNAGVPVVNMTVDTAIGGALYRQLCARCHGDSGQGTTVAPKNIMGQTGMAAVVHAGSGIMPKFTSLSDSDVRSIELFLARFHLTGLDTTSGAAIYRQYCATCHGDSAQGVYGKGQGIQGATNIYAVVHGGGKTMPGFPAVTRSQATLVEQFLAGFAQPTDGAGLYALYCSSCHGARAEGIAGKGTAIQQATNIYDVVHNGGRTMPKSAQLSAAQVQLIEQYLSGFPLPADGAGLYLRYCATCHVTNALGDSTAPGLAGRIGIWPAVHGGSGRNYNGSWRMDPMPSITQNQSSLIESWLATVRYDRTGRNLYVINCQTCHGYRTTGVDYLGNRLGSESIRGKDLGEYMEKVRHGEERMPAFPGISDAEIQSIYAYAQSLR